MTERMVPTSKKALCELDDDQLMIRLQGGDATSFEALVARYQGQIFGFLLNNLRDVQLAEDLTQETLLRVHSQSWDCLLYTSPSPRDATLSRMPSSA